MEKQPIRIEPAIGKHHQIKIMENLARLVILRSVSFNTLLDRELDKSPNNIDYLLITAVIDNDTEEKFVV